jgi:glucosamine--fructose-6-phosphate aminotransferase (isomerizing)
MTSPDWHTDEFPELRSGPPWVMQEMIAAEPALVETILSDPPEGTSAAAEAIAEAIAHHRPVIVCGCGTSEHAAHGVAALLEAAIDPSLSFLVQARPALSAMLDPAPGVCVVISHDGETRASILAMAAARTAGARTVAITQQRDAGVARAAEHVLVTPLHDQSWCHTVAYTSALAAGAALAGAVSAGAPGTGVPTASAAGVPTALAAEPAAARALLQRASRSPQAASVAARLADRRVVLCAGAGSDLTTARELALKIAEGARLPTVALELETVLHGQLAGHEPADAIILVALTDGPERERLARRAGDVARAAATIGLSVAGLFSQDYDEALAAELTPAGRLVSELPDPTLIDARLAGLLAGAGALQTLALELAHARGVNPDLIRREQDPYRHAADTAESSADW